MVSMMTLGLQASEQRGSHRSRDTALGCRGVFSVLILPGREEPLVDRGCVWVASGGHGSGGRKGPSEDRRALWPLSRQSSCVTCMGAVRPSCTPQLSGAGPQPPGLLSGTSTGSQRGMPRALGDHGSFRRRSQALRGQREWGRPPSTPTAPGL